MPGRLTDTPPDPGGGGGSEPAPDPVGTAGSGSFVTLGSVPGGFGQLVLDRPQGRLRPRRETELAEDVRNVGPGGALGDEQRGADLLVAHPLAEKPKDVLLAVGQRLDGLVLAGLLGAHPLGEEPGYGRVEVDLACERRANRGRDLLGLGVLQ